MRLQGGTEVPPRDHREDHQAERQPEDPQHGLLPAGHRHGRPGRCTGRGIVSFGGGNHRPGRIGLDPPGIPQHIQHGDSGTDGVHDQPQPDAVAQRDARGVRGHPGRERVHRRGQRPHSRADHDDPDPHQPVVTQADDDRQDDRVKSQRLLGHPVGGPADGEDHHQDHDQQQPALAEPVGDPPDSCIQRPGLDGDGDERADRQDEEEHLDRAGQIPAVVRPRIARRGDDLGRHLLSRHGPAGRLALLEEIGVRIRDNLGRRPDPVQAVDRRHPQVIQPFLEGAVDSDAVEGAGNRLGRTPVATDIGVRTRLDDKGQDPDQHQHEEQHGERGRELEPALGLGGRVVRAGLRVGRHDARRRSAKIAGQALSARTISAPPGEDREI